MPTTNDYDETRACLRRARTVLGEAHLAVGQTNLPPSVGPQAIRAQIDELDEMIRQASAELDAAREAATRAGRQNLRLV